MIRANRPPRALGGKLPSWERKRDRTHNNSPFLSVLQSEVQRLLPTRRPSDRSCLVRYGKAMFIAATRVDVTGFHPCFDRNIILKQPAESLLCRSERLPAGHRPSQRFVLLWQMSPIARIGWKIPSQGARSRRSTVYPPISPGIPVFLAAHP